MITVNGKVISDRDIAREVQYHPAPTLEEATREASVALVLRELLLQEAAALGIDAEVSAGQSKLAPEEQLINRLLEREVRVPDADDEACRRYYESNPGRFRSPDIFEASHILFPAPPGDEPARAAAREAAAATLAELERDPEAFGRLAKERSADSATAEQGGALGQITRGQTTPEFEACLCSLRPGETCREPVETRFGFHVIRLDRESRGRPLSYGMVRERVAGYLCERAWSLAVRQYMQTLVGKASIEGIELEGASSPLVQ